MSGYPEIPPKLWFQCMRLDPFVRYINVLRPESYLEAALLYCQKYDPKQGKNKIVRR